MGSVKVSALVLAAGGSSRMRGANKLLLPIEGLPMIATVCGAVLNAGCKPTIVITGFDPTALRAALQGVNVRFAHNPRWQTGMSSSIKVGLAALPKDADGVLIALADMPLVTVATLKELLAGFAAGGGRKIVYPVFDGVQGNPVLFPGKYFQEIAALTGDRGAKAVLQRHANDATAVAVATRAVILDCDEQEDYLKLQASWEEEPRAAA
ncbi:MAG: nucleotidyltransferase family protein [Candidatus Marinimicrobia bacterium]|nr:nucleotidyltransferase family protein [Candidatus Neomarinimicrobiota bacterium]